MSTFTDSLGQFLPDTFSAQSEFELWFDTKKEIFAVPLEFGTTTLPTNDMIFHYISIPRYSALFLNVLNNVDFFEWEDNFGNSRYQVFDHGAYIGNIF